jgi:hypothetical protein
MKMHRIILILFLTANACFAQQYQRGLILPDFDKLDEEDVCCIYSPVKGFSVYDGPNGIKIGTFLLNRDSKSDNEALYNLLLLNVSNQIIDTIKRSNFKEIGYEVWALSYFERKNGYVRVTNRTVDFWLSEMEISKRNFRVENWMNFLITNAENLLGYYANDPGLNLRTQPSIESELLLTIKGDLFEIVPTSEFIGNWVKIKINKYTQHPCESMLQQDELIEYSLEGWIKIVDERGEPNVWYYSRGC